MPERTPPAWGEPIAAINRTWTNIEQRLVVWVLVAEIAALTGWVMLKGLAAEYTPGGNVIGLIFRSILSAIVLGLAAHLLTRPRGAAAGASAQDLSKASRTNTIAVSAAVIIGLFAGRLWVGAFTAYDSNLVEWLQNASSVAMMGGPRGVVTRLTLWLAMLGASLAAARGKHINIDLATRYVPQRLAAPVAITGWAAAALVCFAASWGFVDGIAVTKFRAEAFHACPAGSPDAEAGKLCETTVSERLTVVATSASKDLFLLRKQLLLDLKTLPRVITGERYDQWLTASAWNAWIQGGGWEDYYPPAAVTAILAPSSDPDQKRMPAVVEPGTGLGRGLLIRDLDFILPFGLFVVALKFLLRILLVLSGQVKVDPNAAHDDEDMKHAHDHDKDVEEAEADALARQERVTTEQTGSSSGGTPAPGALLASPQGGRS